MVDEFRRDALGCAGHKFVQTPNLDTLAARGTRFTNAYTNCPICVPARAAFATGNYANKTGYWDNSIAWDGRIRSWSHVLQDAGVKVETTELGDHYDPDAKTVRLLPQHFLTAYRT